MRIAVVTHSSNLEGAERSVLEIIRRLIGDGHQVIVIVRQTGDFTSVLKEEGVEFHEVKYGWWSTDGKSFSKSWLEDAHLKSSKIAELIKEFRSDLVYSNTSVIPFGALAAAQAGVPHIWHIRELASGKVFDRYREALNQIGTLINYGSNRIIFNSEASLNSWKPFLKNEGITEVIYNAVPSYSLQRKRKDGPYRVALIGSVIPIKKQLEALEAFATETVGSSEMELDLIGPIRDESYYEELRKFADENGLKGKVHFKGFRDNPFSDDPDLCLVCGNSEGFGRVIPEAIMQGIPVLAARGGATNELIREGETGFLYDSGNVEELSGRLVELKDSDLDAHTAKARKVISEMFSESNTLQRMIDSMESVSKEENPLSTLSLFLNPFSDHKSHLKFVKSADLLKEVLRRRLF